VNHDGRRDGSPGESYEPDRLGRGFEGELERLRAQVEMSWNVEHCRLAALGVEDGQRIVELGCGPGFVTQRLASWLPRGTIVGVDPDPRMLAVASRVAAEAGAGRVALLRSTAAATALRSDSFDGAISRYLYQHLADPVGAAAETLRILRPGGYHIIIEVDDGLWGLAQPEFPAFRDWHRRRARAQSRRGGDRFIGRRLGRIFRAAGYVRIQLDLFAYNSDDLGMQTFALQLGPEQFVPLVEEGSLTFDDYLRACVATRQFFDSDDPFLLLAGFIARAEKPR
jgi:ubiquinone/menaquinone biosynthesis C-methylase UbiE